MWISMKTKEADCPIGKVVDLLGDSCSILILRDLLEGPKRYGELEESLDSSSRTLVKKLKLLEQEGLITHKMPTKKHIKTMERIWMALLYMPLIYQKK